MEEKRNWKQELKDFWEEYGPRIKTGVKCLALGWFVGFIRGASSMAKINAKNDALLIEMLNSKEDEDNEGDQEIDEFFEVLKKNGWEVKKF